MVTIRSRTLLSLIRSEQERLSQLSYGLVGGMQRKLPAIIHAQRNAGEDDPVHEARAILAYDKAGYICGWALLFPSVTYLAYAPASVSGWNCYVFVDPKSRRQGIGTRLCKAALNLQSSARFYPSSRNHQFFNALKEHCPSASFSRDPACYIQKVS